MADEARRAAIRAYQQALVQTKRQEANIAALREELREQGRRFRKSEDDIKALQSVGQLIGEVLKHLGGDKYIVKASQGPRYIVGCRDKVGFPSPPPPSWGVRAFLRCQPPFLFCRVSPRLTASPHLHPHARPP
jgi:hypothetical protein